MYIYIIFTMLCIYIYQIFNIDINKDIRAFEAAYQKVKDKHPMFASMWAVKLTNGCYIISIYQYKILIWSDHPEKLPRQTPTENSTLKNLDPWEWIPYTYIYHKNQPVMKVNVPYMDPLGYIYWETNHMCFNNSFSFRMKQHKKPHTVMSSSITMTPLLSPLRSIDS